MKLWKYRDKDECPLYAEKEDTYHISRCTSTAASNKWEKTIQSLEATLAANHTPRESIKIIAEYLHLWRDMTTSVPQCTTPTLKPAILAQDLIRWQAFIEGCLSIEWRNHVSTFLPKIYSPRRWTALLVKKLWLVAFDMWDHWCKILHKNDLSNKIQDLE